MRAFFCLAVAATLAATVANAQTCGAGLCTTIAAFSVVAPRTTCDTEFFTNMLSASTSVSSPSTDNVLHWYLCCTDFNAGSQKCVQDPCLNHTGTIDCTENRNCAALPKHSNGQSQAVPSVCVRKDKLCGLLTLGSQCDSYGFCFNDNGRCAYIDPSAGSSGAATLAPGDDVSSKCAALHPMVIAMLALMFVTLVGAIIIVGVIVVINQRRADDEDKKKEAESLAKGRRGGV